MYVYVCVYVYNMLHINMYIFSYLEICMTGEGKIYITELHKVIESSLSFDEILKLYAQIANTSDIEKHQQVQSIISAHRIVSINTMFYYFDDEQQKFLQKPSMRIKRKQFAFIAIN